MTVVDMLGAAADDAETKPSAQEAVHSDAEANVTAHEPVHAEPEPSPRCHEPASSSEVIVDSDSVYSVCYSDVTSDAADIVHVINETSRLPARGISDQSCLLSVVLLCSFSKAKALVPGTSKKLGE